MEELLSGYVFPEAPRVDAAGNLYFSDIIDRGGGACALYDGVQFPNGVGFSPDGRTLYHSDYAAAHVLAHTIAADGRAVERRIFAAPPHGRPDGLAVDEAGGVWIALGDGGGVARFDAEGALDRVLAVPAAFVASLCFGGADRRDLYVAGVADAAEPARGGTIWRTRVDVPGWVAPLARV
jgi:sugar lactone lactonase YvrE